MKFYAIEAAAAVAFFIKLSDATTFNNNGLHASVAGTNHGAASGKGAKRGWAFPVTLDINERRATGVEYNTLDVVELFSYVAASIRELPPPPPPEEQATVEYPEGANVVDWTQPEGVTGIMLSELGRFKAGTYVDPETGKKTHNITGLLADFLKNDGGSLFVSTDVLIMAEGARISIYNMTIYGLDTYTQFEGPSVVAPQTLNYDFALENLTIVTSLGVGQVGRQGIQHFSITYTISNMTGSTPVVAVIDEGIISNTPLGCFMDFDYIEPTVLAAAYTVHTPYINITSGVFSTPIVDGLSPETDMSEANLTENLETISPYVLTIAFNARMENQLAKREGCPLVERDAIDSKVPSEPLVSDPTIAPDDDDRSCILFDLLVQDHLLAAEELCYCTDTWDVDCIYGKICGDNGLCADSANFHIAAGTESTNVNYCIEFVEDSGYENGCTNMEFNFDETLASCKTTYGGKDCVCEVCDDLRSLSIDCSMHDPGAITNGCQSLTDDWSPAVPTFEFPKGGKNEDHDSGGGTKNENRNSAGIAVSVVFVTLFIFVWLVTRKLRQGQNELVIDAEKKLGKILERTKEVDDNTASELCESSTLGSSIADDESSAAA